MKSTTLYWSQRYNIEVNDNNWSQRNKIEDNNIKLESAMPLIPMMTFSCTCTNIVVNCWDFMVKISILTGFVEIVI